MTKLLISIDTGGTFTDIVYVVNGELRVLKVFSTPNDPARAILDALSEMHINGPFEVRHGTTVATNSLLERTGARTAFVTTAGFDDAIAIGRQARPSLYDWFASPDPPLAPAELRFGVDERTDLSDKILRCPEEGALKQLAESLQRSRAEAVAVSLLFSFANPKNEKAVVSSLRRLGVPISASHEILPEFREYERSSTVLINAYLAPKVGAYLNSLSASLQENYLHAKLQIM